MKIAFQRSGKNRRPVVATVAAEVVEGKKEVGLVKELVGFKEMGKRTGA